MLALGETLKGDKDVLTFRHRKTRITRKRTMSTNKATITEMMITLKDKSETVSKCSIFKHPIYLRLPGEVIQGFGVQCQQYVLMTHSSISSSHLQQCKLNTPCA